MLCTNKINGKLTIYNNYSIPFISGVWEQLMMATNDACQAVKKHISCTLQDVDTNPDVDVDQVDINQVTGIYFHFYIYKLCIYFHQHW